MSDAKTQEQMRQAADSLVGRTIERVHVEDNGGDWSEHESFLLVFTDGSRARFASWGHDAWGAVLETFPTESQEVPANG